MDQYSPAIITVPANMSSVEISQFPDNGTSIVANREYTITVSAISDQGTSYPSDPVTVSKYSCTNVYTYACVYLCSYKSICFVYTVTLYVTTYVHTYVHP